ncbi:MAG: hypothetical protein PHH57_03535 [Candidatus Omnitrophica bacterium]|nr:hypothetical protein [Candidatus Omnitrophota bacterium]
MNNRQCHLNMIQNVINRISRNSFLLKGWSIILISAFFALAAANSKVYFVFLAYFPLIIFWILDAYFLWQERLFRALYDHVRGLKEEEIDFSMNTSKLTNVVSTWMDVIVSKTLIMFHGTVLISIIIVMLIMLLTN